MIIATFVAPGVLILAIAAALFFRPRGGAETVKKNCARLTLEDAEF